MTGGLPQARGFAGGAGKGLPARAGPFGAGRWAPWFVLALAVGGLVRPAPGQVEPSTEPQGVVSVRELLELEGCGPLLQQAQSGPLSRADEARLAWAVTRVAPWQLSGETGRQPVSADDWRKPELVVGRAVRLRGRLIQFEVEPLAGEIAQRWDFSELYRGRLQLEGTSIEVDVVSRQAPREWQAQPPGAVLAGGWGVMMGADVQASPVRPRVVLSRWQWYADQPPELADFDRGLWNQVQDRTRLTAADHEPFFALLKLVSREPAEPPAKATSDSVVPLFNEPASQRGRVVRLAGTARRIVRIAIENADTRKATGLDHYFEVEFFTPDSQRSPLVVCAPRLAEGIVPGENQSQPIRLAGVFFKVWAYRSRAGVQATDEGRGQLQLAPLIIAPVVARGAEPAPPSGRIGFWLLVALGLGGTGLVTWLAVWRGGVPNRAAVPRGSESPDFSHLNPE